MATQVLTITDTMVREHQQLMWLAHPSGNVTVRIYGVIPDDSDDAVVRKTADGGVWLLRNCGGCTLPVRAVFDERGLFCTWQPTRERWDLSEKDT